MRYMKEISWMDLSNIILRNKRVLWIKYFILLLIYFTIIYFIISFKTNWVIQIIIFPRKLLWYVWLRGYVYDIEVSLYIKHFIKLLGIVCCFIFIYSYSSNTFFLICLPSTIDMKFYFPVDTIKRVHIVEGLIFFFAYCTLLLYNCYYALHYSYTYYILIWFEPNSIDTLHCNCPISGEFPISNRISFQNSVDVIEFVYMF